MQSSIHPSVSFRFFLPFGCVIALLGTWSVGATDKIRISLLLVIRAPLQAEMDGCNLLNRFSQFDFDEFQSRCSRHEALRLMGEEEEQSAVARYGVG